LRIAAFDFLDVGAYFFQVFELPLSRPTLIATAESHTAKVTRRAIGEAVIQRRVADAAAPAPSTGAPHLAPIAAPLDDLSAVLIT
jgi:hypothetical protein